MISNRSAPLRPSSLPMPHFDPAKGGLRAGPEPRLPVKHALNPPIVTIFGAGVAGLTAAHELMERGFLVQVIENAEDPYFRGRPRVGGMAANQYGRVRANLEDLHQALFDIAVDPKEAKDRKEIVASLLSLFAFNRVRWIQAETPAKVDPAIFDPPKPEDERLNKLEGQLREARKAFRKRWLWDVIVRAALTEPVSGRPGGSGPWSTDALGPALSVFDELLNNEDAVAVAAQLIAYGDGTVQTDATGSVGTAADPHSWFSKIAGPALEREFLAFRLVPLIREGADGAEIEARKLLRAWTERIKRTPSLRDHFLARDEPEPVVSVGSPLPDGTPKAWLNVEIIEQRIPGEHGYRFFPSSYRNLDDTMRRIPILDDCCQGVRTVIDNLRPTTTQGLGMTYDELDASKHGDAADGTPFPKKEVPPSPPRRPGAAESLVVKVERDRAKSLKGLRDRTDRFVQQLGGTRRDGVLFYAKILRFMLASTERRRGEYEGKNWADFIEMNQFSPAMRAQLQAASQVLLAFSLAKADARTYGDTAIQLLLDMFSDGERADRTLNGPTSDAWLEPWRLYLESKGVRFFLGKIKGIETLPSGEVVPQVELRGDKCSQDGCALLDHNNPLAGHQPDFYILALELGGTVDLVKSLGAQDRCSPDENNENRDFQCLAQYGDALKNELKDMTGLQLYFDAKTSIGQGHMYYPLAPWGLSAISQSEFWSRRSGFADGYIGVLSVDICDTATAAGQPLLSFWDTFKTAWSTLPTEDTSLKNLYARLLVSRRVRDEIAQRTGYADNLGTPRCFHVDDNISLDNGQTPHNGSPYLAATPDAWKHRAGRYQSADGTEIVGYSLNHRRWVFAGTYMATYTRMTTMEAANESGRHAARTILKRLMDRSSKEKDDRKDPQPVKVKDHEYFVYTGENKTYNGYSIDRIYDLPDIWNPERNELDDLQSLRRIDAGLYARDANWPHIFDLLELDKKLKLALDAAEIYGDDSHLHQLMPLTFASLDRIATGLGPGDEKSVLGDSLKRILEALTSGAAQPEVRTVNDFVDKFRRAR